MFLLTLALGMQAQPTVFGTQLVDGTYTTYDLVDRGAFRQLRLQASTAGAGRNWEFASGTAAATDYSNNWRPYTSNLTLSSFNAVIPPVSGTASALFNSSFGGQSGFLPNVASGNYYTINVTESAGDNHMAILETSYAPATISSVTGPACATNCGYTVTVNLSGTPATGEYAYVRFSTDGFATSGFIILSFSGATGTADIPDLGSSTVAYYVFTSSSSILQLIDALNTYGDLAYDMLTLELGNNGGANYSYSPCATSNPVAVCQNTTVNLDNTGNASITTADIDGGSFDNCGLPALSASRTAFTCSDLVAGTPTELFFSEYVEGSGDNKYIEIFNGTGAAVNLGNYLLRLYSNGSATPTTTNTLSGTLNPGQVIVLRNSGAAIYAGPSTIASAINFNGDDAVELYNTALGATADIIGRIGEDPGTQWTGGGNSTLNRTLSRKSTILAGVATNPASGFPTLATEWDGLSIDDVSGLGRHGIGATVTLAATGDGGAQSSCLAVVTVVDDEMPDAVCQDVTVDIETGGTYTLAAADIDGGSSDNCTASLSIPATVFDCSDVGSTVSVLLTVTDESGNSASCSADVTVGDGNNICNQAPTAVCQAVTVDADANCQGTAAAADFDGGSTDPEMGMLSFSADPAGPYSLGMTSVTLTVMDPGGASDQCMTTITVTDNAAPTITCPADVTMGVGSQCQLIVPDFTGGPIFLANSVTGFSGTQGGGGWYYGQYFTGGYQNFSQLPTYNSGVPQWQDNQPFDTPFLDANGGHPGTDDFKLAVRRWVSSYTGTVDISLAFYDRDGNCGDGAHVRVLLNGTQIWEYLNIPTSLVTQSFSQAVAAGDILDFVIDPITNTGCDNTQFATLISAPNGLATSDNCGTVNVSQDPAPGTLLGPGITPVTLTATDGNNNSESCDFNLTVVDNTAPTAACQPATVQLNASGMGSIAASDVFDATNSSDNCGTVNPQSVSPASFSCANIGANMVTLTVNDGNGNTSTCEASVAVEDKLAPTAACQPATVQLDASGMGSIAASDVFDAANSSDNCGTVSPQSVSPSSFSCANIGANMVTLTVNDGNGNTSTCEASVTVEDKLAPTAACQPATVQLDAAGMGSIAASDVFDAANSSDNCGTVSPQSVSPSSFSCANIGGTNMVTLTVNDGNGNTSTCMATVMVEDPAGNCNQPPTAVCQPVTVDADANCQGTAAAADFDGGSTDPEMGMLSFSVDPDGPYFLGMTSVTLTVMDPGGASSQCMTTITVVDNAAPTAACQPATVQLNASGTASITPAAVFNAAGSSDNCGTVNPQSVSPGSFSCANIGANMVTLTVNDGNGNTSTCMASVTVEDKLAPTAACKPATVQLNTSGMGSITPTAVFNAAGSSDNCGTVSPQSVSPSSFSCANKGASTVTLTVNDGNGNTSTCTATVTVQDNLAPTAACQPATVQLNASGMGSIAASDVFDAANSSDNCGTVSPQSVSPSSFSCADVGSRTVTLTVNDGNGNTSTCTASVSVTDPNGFCSQVVCFDTEVSQLIAYIKSLRLRSTVERNLTNRLNLAADKFCDGASAGTIISYLNLVISYTQSQSGGSIPTAAANYIIAEVQALINAVSAGTAECCSGEGRPLPPTGPVGKGAAYELDVIPNPFASEAAISFYLPEAGPAGLEVFNLQGQRVSLLLAETLDAGRHTHYWAGTADGGQQLSAGIYLVRLRTETGVLVKKVSLVR